MIAAFGSASRRKSALSTVLITTSVAVFILGSIIQWKLILASIISMLLTPIVMGSPAAALHQPFQSGLLELWLAAIVWLTCAAWIVRLWMRHRKHHATTRGIFSASAAEIGILVIALTGLLAPFIAPADPASQGNLAAGRLLEPMEERLLPSYPGRGINSPVRTERPTESVAHSIGALNHQLIHRDESNPRKTMRAYFGTDELARDVFSRVIYGLRLSLFIGIAGMTLSIILGIAIGVLSAFGGGWLNGICTAMTDMFLSVPTLFLAITAVAFLGNSIPLLVIILGVSGWMGVARLVRGQLLTVRESDFVAAARMLGRSPLQIARDHLLPNVLPTILVSGVLQFGNVIFAETALSFLGLGVQQPTPSLGNLIGDSVSSARTAWWTACAPGVVLSVLLLTVQRWADDLQRGIGRAG